MALGMTEFVKSDCWSLKSTKIAKQGGISGDLGNREVEDLKQAQKGIQGIPL
jgi:hypothetical protein